MGMAEVTQQRGSVLQRMGEFACGPPRCRRRNSCSTSSSGYLACAIFLSLGLPAELKLNSVPLVPAGFTWRGKLYLHMEEAV